MATATKTQVVPTDTTVSHAADAVLAVERLTDALTAASNAGNAVLVARYGADIDPAAVKLARSAALEMSGGTKSRGGARANVLAVIDALTDVDSLSDKVFVAAARTRLDQLAADKRARTERKKELAAKVNDQSASVTERTAALEVLAGMDSADAGVKSAAIIDRLIKAIAAAHDDGMGEYEIHELVSLAYGSVPSTPSVEL